MHKILVIGAVNTTKHILNQLVKHGFNIVGVLGHEPAMIERVSGWTDLKTQAENLSIAYKGFVRINEIENIIWAKEKAPDIIFAVGFSQLISEEWLQMPSLGCIGFHPTYLPKGRGRAPLAWITLEQSIGSATFFLMGKGADDGPVFVQETFLVEKEDDATSVEQKIEKAIIKSLDKWLPELKKGVWEPIIQDEEEASWYGKRSLEDGNINWNNSANYIDRLIKASTHPHPGAYTYFKDAKVIIWKSEVETKIPIKGVVGRILLTDDKRGLLVQCGTGLVWLKNIEKTENLKINVGDKLGYNIEDEIFKIKSILKSLQNE
ncbi:methionyl-tRNA formyltransferase [Myroides indicus]|uniref:Methionyl-tRNA formyltransferase n=1 Tax=Myroides indicus TaxID=1323422 RepID=A0A4R7F5P9_9FLAO|nr:formyltransferase family protein [Myroides indicus]TDS65012.1 methionyl-tRNA formyltransferase [Myroides indicus]